MFKIDYTPAIANVHGVHIGIIVALIVLFAWFTGYKPAFGTSKLMSSVPSPAQVNPNVPSNPYLPYDYRGWVNTQYNQLGAYSGALYGEAN